MVNEHRRVSVKLAADGSLFQGYAEWMAEVHNRNAAKLEVMINQMGWPGIVLVGADGAEAVGLILQHAIGNPTLQRKCLPILRELVDRGEASLQQVAHLADRICFFERRPQRYGTQFDWDEQG